MLPAIDVEKLPGNGIHPTEEENRLRQFSEIDLAAERQRRQRLLHAGVFESDRREHRPRADPVEPQIPRTEFPGEGERRIPERPARERITAPLRRFDRGLLVEQIDHTPLGQLLLGGKSTHQCKRTPEVDLEMEPVPGLASGGKPAGAVEGSVVDQHIDPADGGEKPLRLAGPGEIGAEDPVAVRLRQRRQQLFRFGAGVAAVNRHPGSRGGETADQFGSDPAGAAGDQNVFFLKKHDVLPLKKCFFHIILLQKAEINCKKRGSAMKLYRCRFTLVEILVALAIISMLAAIGFGSYSFAMNSARESATKSMLKQLEIGLSSIRSQCGYYPSTSESYDVIKITFDSNNLPEKVEFGGTELPEDARLVFLKALDIESIRKNVDSNNRLLDSWGTPIYYCYPGKIRKTSYELISAGEDGKFTDAQQNSIPSSPKKEDFTESDDLTNL